MIGFVEALFDLLLDFIRQGSLAVRTDSIGIWLVHSVACSHPVEGVKFLDKLRKWSIRAADDRCPDQIQLIFRSDEGTKKAELRIGLDTLIECYGVSLLQLLQVSILSHHIVKDMFYLTIR